MTTEREKKLLNKNWLRKLLRGEPHFVIGEGDTPYLRRWFLVPRNSFVNIYLHHFLRSDDDRALHDHPWPFLSLILKGGYWEHRAGKLLTAKSWRSAGSVAIRRPGTLHRVELDTVMMQDTEPSWEVSPGIWAQNAVFHPPYLKDIPCWTLVITGPKVRTWGFDCKPWKPWYEFDRDNGCAE